MTSPLIEDHSTLFALAHTAHREGKLTEARQLYTELLAAAPDHVDALQALGQLQLAAGEAAEARATLERCGRLAPHRAELFRDLGRACFLQNAHAEAQRALVHALALEPRLPDAQAYMGDTLLALRDFPGAVAAFQNALVWQPHHAGARLGIGLGLFGLQQYEAASHSLRLATDAPSPDPRARDHLALALTELARFDEAIAVAETGIAHTPERSDAYLILGIVLERADRLDDAIAAFRRAIALQPSHHAAANNLANALVAQHRVDEAILLFDDILANAPQAPDARYNRGLAHLLRGDFAAGWEGYAVRFAVSQSHLPGHLPIPFWDGHSSLHGRTLLLRPEQGFGDLLQFARYARLAADAGAVVHLGVPPELRSLGPFFDGVTQALSIDDPVPPIDLQCPLLTAPHAFGTRFETIPNRVPYLRVPPEKVEAWRTALGPGTKVGLVWSGNPAHKNDRRRSVALQPMATLLSVPEVRFFSLQKGLRPADAELLAQLPNLSDLGPKLNDFADTAAVVENLDLVICVDTSIAHLAGALGKPVWVLLAHSPDWRWMLHREDSPWYPTMRLFRQPRAGDWDSVIASVHAALAARVAQSR